MYFGQPAKSSLPLKKIPFEIFPCYVDSPPPFFISINFNLFLHGKIHGSVTSTTFGFYFSSQSFLPFPTKWGIAKIYPYPGKGGEDSDMEDEDGGVWEEGDDMGKVGFGLLTLVGSCDCFDI